MNISYKEKFFNAQNFEQCVIDIMKAQFTDVIVNSIIPDTKIICDFQIKNHYFEVKYIQNNNSYHLLNLINNIINNDKNTQSTPITIITNVTLNELDKIKSKLPKHIKILSLEHLLFLCPNNIMLQNLLSTITFSTENIIPQKIDKSILDLELIKHNLNNPLNINSELNDIMPGKNDCIKFEKFIEKYVYQIFSDNIEIPISQKQNNNNLYRFDLISAIKDDPKSFWKFIYDKFNSCFILFECKNYNSKISQNEIYLTERYLYNSALRNVAIMITRKGGDKNAIRACQGILKEHGKLILILDDNDLIKMEDLSTKANNETEFSPSDYLLDKAKKFLLELDK